MNKFKISNVFDPNEEKDEYVVDDFDNPDGWHWKEVEHLIEMGFEIAGDTRLKLSDKKEYDETLDVEIYKQLSPNVRETFSANVLASNHWTVFFKSLRSIFIYTFPFYI